MRTISTLAPLVAASLIACVAPAADPPTCDGPDEPIALPASCWEEEPDCAVSWSAHPETWAACGRAYACESGDDVVCVVAIDCACLEACGERDLPAHCVQ